MILALPQAATSRKPISRAALEKSAQKRAADALERKAKTVELGGGWITYPDKPPGVGWIVWRKGQPLRYFRDRDRAIEAWEREYLQWQAGIR